MKMMNRSNQPVHLLRPRLTCQLPLLRWDFASGLDHRHRPKITVGDPHEEGEEAGPGGMGQHGRAGRVHTHDKQRDEDHPEAGEEEQAASGPVVWQRCQDLRTEGGGGSVRLPGHLMKNKTKKKQKKFIKRKKKAFSEMFFLPCSGARCQGVMS